MRTLWFVVSLMIAVVAFAVAAAPTHAQPPVHPALVATLEDPEPICARTGDPPILWFECNCGEVFEGCQAGCLDIWKAWEDSACQSFADCVQPHDERFRERWRELQAEARECIKNAADGPAVDVCLNTYQAALDALLDQHEEAIAACAAEYEAVMTFADLAYENCVAACCAPCPPPSPTVTTEK